MVGPTDGPALLNGYSEPLKTLETLLMVQNSHTEEGESRVPLS